jgi:hypothetical protein
LSIIRPSRRRCITALEESALYPSRHVACGESPSP